MSIPINTVCQCQNCGKTHEVATFSTLNSDYAPNTLEKVMSGEFFLDTCPGCGLPSLLDYDVLFTDLKHRTVIYVLHGNGKKYDKKVAEIRENGINLYKYSRLVSSVRELAEKVTCFEYGIDDRYLEIFKIMDNAAAERHNPNFKIKHTYFHADSSGKYIHFVDKKGQMLTHTFNEDYFESIKQIFKPYVEKASYPPYPLINKLWAEKIVDRWFNDCDKKKKTHLNSVPPAKRR